MDATFWLLFGAIVAYSCAFLVVGALFYRKIRAFELQIQSAREKAGEIAQQGIGNVTNAVVRWAFDEQKQEIDDPANPGTKKTVTIRTPSAAFKGMVSVMVPELIGQAIVWWKENAKKGNTPGALEMASSMPGAELAAAIQPALKQAGVPKEIRGLITLGIQFKDQIQGLIGGWTKPGAGAPGGKDTLPANPFLK